MDGGSGWTGVAKVSRTLSLIEEPGEKSMFARTGGSMAPAGLDFPWGVFIFGGGVDRHGSRQREGWRWESSSFLRGENEIRALLYCFYCLLTVGLEFVPRTKNK